MKRCGAKRRDGQPCQKWAMELQERCRLHGGSSPQSLRKASERIFGMVDPAASAVLRGMRDKDAGVRVRSGLGVLGMAVRAEAREDTRVEAEAVVEFVLHYNASILKWAKNAGLTDDQLRSLRRSIEAAARSTPQFFNGDADLPAPELPAVIEVPVATPHEPEPEELIL